MGSPRLQLPPALARLCATPVEQPLDAQGQALELDLLELGLLGVDAVLPDGGLPRGSVIELTAAAGLGQVTRLALAACAAAQAQSRKRRRDARSSWCAWLDPFSSLYAPGAAAAGIDLAHLLVVCPPLSELARIAVRVVASGIFSVVVVDRSGVAGALAMSEGERAGPNGRQHAHSHTHSHSHHTSGRGHTHGHTQWRTATRRLALAAQSHHSIVLVLSSSHAAQRDLLPTALRLELARPQRDQLSVRVAKDRRGRTSSAVNLSLLELGHPHLTFAS